MLSIAPGQYLIQLNGTYLGLTKFGWRLDIEAKIVAWIRSGLVKTRDCPYYGDRVYWKLKLHNQDEFNEAAHMHHCSWRGNVAVMPPTGAEFSFHTLLAVEFEPDKKPPHVYAWTPTREEAPHFVVFGESVSAGQPSPEQFRKWMEQVEDGGGTSDEYLAAADRALKQVVENSKAQAVDSTNCRCPSPSFSPVSINFEWVDVCSNCGKER
jgi:hypothetical protein